MGGSGREELNRYPPPSLVSCESWMCVKENPDRKKKVKLDLSNYATKSYLKGIWEVNKLDIA